MQRLEEKQLESTLDGMIQRVQDIRTSITQFLWKLDNEHDRLNWPSMLDSFALLTSQISSLQKLLQSDKTAQLRNYVLIPLHLSPDRDVELEKATEGRVVAFSHEVVPDYLRTKPEIDVEQKMQQISQKCANLQVDTAQKQVNQLNKVCSHILDLVQIKRDEWESDSGHKRSQTETSSQADTNVLVSAAMFGKGLRHGEGVQSQLPNSHSDLAGPSATTQQQLAAQRAAPVPTINLASGKTGASIRPTVRTIGNQYARP